MNDREHDYRVQGFWAGWVLALIGFAMVACIYTVIRTHQAPSALVGFGDTADHRIAWYWEARERKESGDC